VAALTPEGRTTGDESRRDPLAGERAVTDPHGRRLDYLRLSVTDLCDFRCRYCMPPTGVELVPRGDVLSWEEMLRLCRVFCSLGLRKLRITGGEPFVRPGLLDFLDRVRRLPAPPRLHITTNGTRLREHLPRLSELGIKRLNISLDSLRPQTFARIARRNAFKRVWQAVLAADAAGFGIKLNVVVLSGINEDEIGDFVELTRNRDWTVRFIEAMPFDGLGGRADARVTGDAILQRIFRDHELVPVTDERSEVRPGVDRPYRVRGYRGRIGIIYSHSRHFCSDCSRWRVNAQGELRTCLYGPLALDLRRLLRGGADDQTIAAALRSAASQRFRDGREAETASTCDDPESMSRIGG
jgi:cyclic pyranopterin phosphate synthase